MADPSDAALAGQRVAAPLRIAPKPSLPLLEGLVGLVTGYEVAEIIHDVVELLTLAEQLAVPLSEGLDQVGHRLQTVVLGVVHQDDASALSGLPLPALENAKESTNHLLGLMNLQIARVESPHHAGVAVRAKQTFDSLGKRAARRPDQPGRAADGPGDLSFTQSELGLDLGVAQERELAVRFRMVADRMTPADDVADDPRMSPLPGIAVAKALARDKENRLDAELVQDIQEAGCRALRGTVIEREEEHASLAPSGEGQTAWKSRAGGVRVSHGADTTNRLRAGLRVHGLHVSGLRDRHGGVRKGSGRDRFRTDADLRSTYEGAASDDRQRAAAQPKVPRNRGHVTRDRKEGPPGEARKPQDLHRSPVATPDRIDYLGRPDGHVVIEVESLSRRYGNRWAVRDVSFRVATGEIVGFLGPNGAGKTTTLRMLTGYLAPSSGAIRIDGIEALQHPIHARQRLGYMPEGVPLYREMRVYEYLRHRAALKGVAEVSDAVDRSLERAGVTDARRRIIGQLSKGYRQRVGLAEALIADPPILILDEPTSGLDPNQVRQFRELVRSFRHDKTVLLSTHILSEVEAVCDRVIIIHAGLKVADLETDDAETSLEEVFAKLTTSTSTSTERER